MNSLEDNIPGMFPEEGQYISNRSLVGKTSETDTISLSTTSDELLWQDQRSGLGKLGDEWGELRLYLGRVSGIH